VIHLVAHGTTVGGLGALWPQARTIPIELRVALEMAALILLAGRVVPWLSVPASTVLVGGFAGMRAALLLGEYSVTSRLRQLRKPPPAVVYAFDDGLDMVVRSGQLAARWTGRALSRRWRLRWLLLALVPLTLLLLRPALAASEGAHPFVATTNSFMALWYPIDGWVMTGHWNGIAPPPAVTACVVGRK
jgi:hypothetical protein